MMRSRVLVIGPSDSDRLSSQCRECDCRYIQATSHKAVAFHYCRRESYRSHNYMTLFMNHDTSLGKRTSGLARINREEERRVKEQKC